ncbi:MAG TPA: ISNCY family transposase [Gemmatimonadaceae bacterium]|nr:ISNCY family transposase [Gemmatimonadaceae bacterium]
MVRRAYAQRSVFEVLLPDGDKLWDPALQQIDLILDDEPLVDLIVDRLARRHPLSRCRGRLSTPATVVLRMLVLKHLRHWSFDECEREVRGSLIYRAFCRIGCERVPDAKTLIRLAHLIDPEVLRQLLERLVDLGRQRRVIHGRRLRVDTTVVETRAHYPTDSSLLVDGVRIMIRTMGRLAARVGADVVRFRDRTRALARRAFAISQRSRAATLRTSATVRAENKARMAVLYQEAMRITRAVVREAETALSATTPTSSRAVGGLRDRLEQTVGLVRRVVRQTRARVLGGNTHYPDKVLSVVEPHTEAIRKGKAAKLTEFGKLVKIQEAENQFVTDYTICPTRIPDGELWVPTLERHQQLFGRPPHLAVADGSFGSRANELAAAARGVRRIVLPRGRGQPRPRWFRHALRWRTGCEGRISVLKHRHGLARCRYRGMDGMHRWVGLGVIANNLLVLGRAAPPGRQW